MENSSLQGLPFYGRIEETLNHYKDADPTWNEIVRALTALNEDGSYASVLGAFEAYYDQNGFVRNMMRLDTQGMQSTPKIVLEELNVSEVPGNSDMLNIEYVSFDENGTADVSSEPIEKEYCVFEPGEYVTISFTFSSRRHIQRNSFLMLWKTTTRSLCYWTQKSQKDLMTYHTFRFRY